MALPLYRTGAVEIDSALGRITVNGEERYLRLQTFQVLQHLVEHRDRLVTKEELMTAIWRETAVTDDALVQCVVDIRKALGDESRNSTFIKTFPKLGYRFVAVVEQVDRVEAPPARILPSEGADVDVQPRRRLWPVALAATVVFVLVTAALLGEASRWFRLSRRPAVETALPDVPGARRIAVMSFENQSDRPELAWLQVGLADMLITDLSRGTGVTVLSREQLSVLLDRVGSTSSRADRLHQALEIARESRAEIVALGSFAAVGDKTRIDVRLHDGRSGRLVGAEAVVADTPDQILTQIDLLSMRVAGRLGLSVADRTKTSSLADVMTNNLEAYRYYVLGVEEANALHVSEAIQQLQKAVALDPEFAMAYARIGYAYAVTYNLPNEARPYLEKAFRASARLTEKNKLYIAAWYANSNLDFPSAVTALREIVARYPEEIDAYKQLGAVLDGEEQFDEAVDVLKRALAIDPRAKDVCNALGTIYNETGKYRDAVAMHQHYVALAPTEANAYDSLGLSYQGAGDYAQASSAFEQAVRLNPRFEIPIVHLGNVYFQLGRYHDAIRQYEKYVELTPFDKDRTRGYIYLAWVHFKRGDDDRAWQYARKALVHTYDALVWTAIPIAFERGDRKTVDDLKRRFLTAPPTGERGRRLSSVLDHHVRGYLALKEGREADAIAHFTEVTRHRPLQWHIEPLQADLADAYLALGRLHAAIDEYNRVLSLQPNLAVARFHLAQAYERSGDERRARSEYERFLQLWRDADADVPELVVAKARLAATTY